MHQCQGKRQEGKTRENSEEEVRWREHFGQLLNGDVMSEAGDDDRMVMKEEMMFALKKIRNGKADSFDSNVMKVLKNRRGISLIGWLLRIFN